MFDEPPSLPMRAAIASLLGSLFGIALILFTHSADAQTAPTTAEAAPLAALHDGQPMRFGEAALRALRASEPLYALGNAGTRSIRLSDSADDAGTGLRWQLARIQGLRSEGNVPRSSDLLSVGVQIRF
jgi:hypothetical protein